eukprot:CAMPEP_0118936266 /NCGR_PEP_ID=MMETSP1169-20130426/17747_1 /TAXON_ID=36882 /ORGANISM="Pyramimonas obovata, Strain CCMP722" /LENGTH=468 /DNA_ID=CAMNT_0006879449 /DNA_START=109 /DNA_END=1512 /DNA_ORIENTATION=+
MSGGVRSPSERGGRDLPTTNAKALNRYAPKGKPPALTSDAFQTKKLYAGALAHHLTASLGAKNPDAKTMIQSEVKQFFQSGNGLKVEDLSELEKTLRTKLGTSQGLARRAPLPSLHQAACTVIPTSIADEQEFYKENYRVQLKRSEADRHNKQNGRGKMRDIMQAKMNDPWAMLIKQDSEKYKAEAEQAKVDYRTKQAKFRQTLQKQIVEKSNRGELKKAQDEADLRLENERQERLKQEEDEKAARRLALRKKTLQDCRTQLDENAEYRRKQAILLADTQREFSERVAAEQEKARQEEQAKKDYNLGMMKSYIAESAASNEIKKLERKKDEEATLKAKREWEKMLDDSERERKKFLDAQKRRQEATTRNAVGNTFEPRYIPDSVQQKYLAKQLKEEKEREAAWWAKKQIGKEDLLEGLQDQMESRKVYKLKEKAEKKMWNDHFVRECNKVEEKHQEELRRDRETRKKW